MHTTTSPELIMARAATENFPVASRVLPSRLRRHLLAIYGFARLVDQLGDDEPSDRLAALDWLEAELDRAFADAARHPIMVALAPTIAACGLPREPFERLIEANRVDQRVHSYETWQDLLGYCHLSADPVGELVLTVFGAATPERITQSDAICTALQLTEHWQDVREDLGRARVYLPLEDLARYGCTIDDLAAPRVTDRLRLVLAVEAGRTARLFRQGEPLLASLRGWQRFALAGYLGGGRAALGAIARSGYEVLALSPRPSRRRTIGAILRVLLRATDV
jgi:squalene synthase HpnC